MGLIHDAIENHPGKERSNLVVPPNCYGGTTTRPGKLLVQIKCGSSDLPVDGDNDMVKSIDKVLIFKSLYDGAVLLILLLKSQPTPG
jgi:hypothetical protein